MQSVQRRSATKVRDGQVQRKNNHSQTLADDIRVERLSGPGWSFGFAEDYPGAGYRHCLQRADLERFFSLIPNFARYAQGLSFVTLASGGPYWGTYHRAGRCIEIHAWQRDRSIFLSQEDLQENPHRAFLASIFGLQKLEASGPCDAVYEECVPEEIAKVWVLLDVFLHELGHHADCMQTSRRLFCPGGEAAAETFALTLCKEIWKPVFREFRI